IAALIIVGALLLLPFAGAALLAYRRAGWEIVSAIAVALVAVTGYLLLDGTVRAISATYAPALYGEGAWTAALRLALLIPYTLLAAWFAPRLAGNSPHFEPPSRAQRLGVWLGLDRWDLPTLILALAVAAMATISWPVTGALGDSLTSLSLACQTLAEVIPQVLLFWGLIFRLLTTTLARSNSNPRWAPLATTMLFAAFTAAGVIPTADWGALMASILLLPLASLLAELRIRGSESSVYPLLLVLYYYRVVPLLFTDPRALLAQSGIPELQHVLSHVISIVTVAVIQVVLSGGRRLLMAARDRAPLPDGARMAAALLAALLAWCAWGGLYIFSGNPGFAND
ncbi:MAG: hypothetical protein GY831_29305, partial [Delftia sp.]|nr:hypothetical protein [Delftia sp.]